MGWIKWLELTRQREGLAQQITLFYDIIDISAVIAFIIWSHRKQDTLTFFEAAWKRFGRSTYAVQTGCPFFGSRLQDNNSRLQSRV